MAVFRPSKRRSGTVLVLATLMLVSSFALLAMAIDLGYVQVVNTELQRSADSAAIAAGWGLLANSGIGGGDPSQAVSQAQFAASQYAALNKVGNAAPQLGSGDVVVGYLSNPSDRTQQIDTTADPKLFNAVSIRVRRTASQNGEVPLFFAKLLGMNSLPNQGQATAAFRNNFIGFATPTSNTNLGILPFALDKETWDALVQGQGDDNWTWDDVNRQIVAGRDGVLEVNLFPQDTGAPGNRGTVNICSGNGNSTEHIKQQILNGITPDDLASFGGRLQLDEHGVLSLNGDTGISAGVEDALLGIKGQTRIIPIFSSVSGPGNNAYYTIVQFAGIRIMDVNLSGSMSSKRVIVQPTMTTALGGIPGGSTQTSFYMFSPVWLVR